MTAYNIWQWFQENEASPGSTADKIQRYLSTRGFTEANNEAMYDWLGSLGFTGTLAERIYQFEFFKTYRYNDIAAKEVLEKFGTDAHCWIPGIGYFNGLQAGNYIDSAGTQAGLVDNPVGLVRDATNPLGPELVTNGDFSSGTGWTITGSASISGGVATCPTGSDWIEQAIPTKAGSVYQVSQTASVNAVYSGAWDNPNRSVVLSSSAGGRSVGYSTFTFTANDSLSYIAFTATGAGSTTLDNISVREVTGAITATQGTTANKPILRRGAVNLLTYSEQFDNAAWGKNQSSVIQNATTAPNGTQTGDLLVPNTASSNDHNVSNGSVVVGVTYTVSIYAKRAGYNYLFIRGLGLGGTGGARFNLLNGTVEGVSGYSSASISSVGNDWYRCVAVGIANAGTGAVFCASDTAAFNTYTGDGTSGIYIWGAQLELGSTASQYIPTTTAAASSSSGNYYWQFDGSNDSLALSSVPFQQSDDHAVIVAARVTTTSAQNTFFSISSNSTTNPLVCDLEVLTSGAYQAFWRDDAGNTAPISGGTVVANQAFVISGRKVSGTRSARVNASSIGTNVNTLGTTTVNTSTIGALVRTTTQYYTNGSIYPVIAIKGTVSDADLLILERWVGQMSGVSI